MEIRLATCLVAGLVVLGGCSSTTSGTSSSPSNVYSTWAVSYAAAHRTLIDDVHRGVAFATIRSDCAEFAKVASTSRALPRTGDRTKDAALARIAAGLTRQAAVCDDAFAGGTDESVVAADRNVPAERRFRVEERKLQNAIDEFNGGLAARPTANV